MNNAARHPFRNAFTTLATTALVFSLLCPAHASAQTAGQGALETAQLFQTFPLKAGKTIKREIKGGDTHTYTFTLRRGEFLRAVATSHGVDVLATLYGPGGKELLTVNLLNYPGPEPVSYVAEQEGTYLLEVYSRAREAMSGRYELASELRASATKAD